MKKSFRLVALLMALCMILGVFAACGDKNSSSTASTGSKASTEGSKTDDGSKAETPEAGDLDTSNEVEVVMYVVSDRPAKQDEIDENMNKIFKEKLNTTLKVNWIGWAEYTNKYPLLFSSGEEFDLSYTATWLNFSSLAQRGAFMELDELWPKYAPKNYERQSQAALEQATVNGKLYCIPTLLPTYSSQGPIYRTDILEGTDWDGKMENFDDLEVYCDYVKQAAPEMEPLNVYSSGLGFYAWYLCINSNYKASVGGNGVPCYFDVTEDKPTVKVDYQIDQIRPYLEMTHRWNEKGFWSKSALSDTDSQKVQGGKAACTIHNIDTYEGRAIDYPERNFKYADFRKDVSYLPFTQDALVVSGTAKNPERALALYDLITSDEETYRAFYNGIEGVSYEIIDGQIKNPDPDNYGFSACWAARTPEFNLPSVGSPQVVADLKAEWDNYIKEQDGKGAARFASFVLDTSMMETEYAAIRNVNQEYWLPLELGFVDLESGLADYQAKMEAAGIEKVLAEMQKQLDAFCESHPAK